MPRYSNNFCVGLTGGIGSGKTTVTDYFTELGAGVIDADEVSRSLTADGQPAIDTIARKFGNKVLVKPGVLNRDSLREIVFNDEGAKRKLEKILHPLIRSRMMDMAAKLDRSYLIISIPLLIESGQQSSFDRILVINAPFELRFRWLKQRSGLDDKQIQQIMDSQISTTERLRYADDVIENSGTLEHLHQQVEKLHRLYLSLSNAHHRPLRYE